MTTSKWMTDNEIGPRQNVIDSIVAQVERAAIRAEHVHSGGRFEPGQASSKPWVDPWVR